jgi:hypothetical protein
MSIKPKKDMLEGRVAQILNERELAINIGQEKGVKLGMVFAVLAEKPLEIIDPETSEVLDVLDREKVRVEVVEIRPKISICRTYVTKVIPGGSLYQGSFSALGSIGVLASAMQPPRKIVETLRADDKALPPPLSPEESYVKIKDRVIQIDPYLVETNPQT